MIVVRDSFQIDPEGMKEAKTLIREGRDIIEKIGFTAPRAMTDLVGDYYSLVLESEFPSLADFETRIRKSMENPDWQKWYAKMRQYVVGGRREVFTILE